MNKKSKSDKKKLRLPKGVCVKVKSLRPRFDNLKEWNDKDDHILVTRRGRVFIERTELYHYPESEWANPFKLSNYTLKKSLELYEAFLEKKLQDVSTLNRFLHLSEAKEIGCFCDPSSSCHRDIILKILRKKLSKELSKE